MIVLSLLIWLLIYAQQISCCIKSLTRYERAGMPTFKFYQNSSVQTICIANEFRLSFNENLARWKANLFSNNT